MKKILLILLLTPFISFGQTDSTFLKSVKKYALVRKDYISKNDTTFFKSLKKYVSVSTNLSFYQKNYSQLEFGGWIPNDVIRLGLTLDNSGRSDKPADYWIGLKTYFEVSKPEERNSFFLYLHPKVSNYLNAFRLNYGIAYIRDKDKRFNGIVNLNFEDTDFILSFGINYTFK
jgi:hypothetical protein